MDMLREPQLLGPLRFVAGKKEATNCIEPVAANPSNA